MNYTIVGGTGTLGGAMIRTIKLQEPNSKIRVISRDEFKQKQLREKYPDLTFVIGDVKDRASLVFQDSDVVFHFAALKHIDIAEDNVFEVVKTNLLGTVNVAQACIEQDVPFCAFSSTDKACLPFNTYGMTKALAEKYLFWMNRQNVYTRFAVFRWGNILGSRGSVVHHFKNSLEKRREVNITDSRMTRFFLHVERAAEFMFANFNRASLDTVCIPPMKAAKIIDLAKTVAEYLNIPVFEIKETGIRQGEKIHEHIYSNHDSCIRSDLCDAMTNQELLDLVRRSYENIY